MRPLLRLPAALIALGLPAQAFALPQDALEDDPVPVRRAPLPGAVIPVVPDDVANPVGAEPGDTEPGRLRFGGHLRQRIERWNGFEFGAPDNAVDDDTFSLWRAVVHATYDVSDSLSVFAQLKAAGASERELPGGTRPIDEDDLALEQLYLDWTIALPDETLLRLRPGRQQLQFGAERLVSPYPWLNTFNRWDGVRLDIETQDLAVTVFTTQFVPVDVDQFNEPDPGTKLHGLHLTRPEDQGRGGLDGYIFWSERTDVVVNGTAGRDERWTVGGRTWTAARDGRHGAELEAAVQVGQLQNEPVRAWMAGGEMSLRFPGLQEALFSLENAPEGYLRFDLGSGDSGRGGRVGTFDQLFPLAFEYFGQADLIGRQNALDLALGARADVTPDLWVELAHHSFWLMDRNDALYNAGGAVVRPGGADDRYVGHEIDLRGAYRISDDLLLTAGLSHVIPGDVPEDTGEDDSIDFAYVSLQFAF